MEQHPPSTGSAGFEAESAARATAFALLDALWDSPTAIAIFDRDLRFVRVNAALALVTSVAAEAHPGRRLRDVAPEGLLQQADRIEEALRGVIESGRPSTFDLHAARPDGSAIDWRCTYHAIRAPPGEVRGVCAILTDVTEEREREAALQRARSDAEQMRALLDAVFDGAPIGMAFLDTALRYVRVNAALAELTGVPHEEHIGRTPREIVPGLPTEQIEAICRSVMATGRPLLDSEIAGELPSSPGRLCYCRVSWYPVRAAGETLGVGALIRETTAEREAEEFQRNVLGIVGHDLRSPLAAISGCAHLLRRAAPGTERLADRILANTARMDRMIAMLLDYARVRGGQPVPLDRRPCDVAATCRSAAEEAEAAGPTRRIVATCTCSARTARWDPDRIAQVLANLLANALQYSSPNSTVDVRCHDEGDDVAIEVSNEGPPIPPELVPRLFEPFHRGARGPGGREGLGLGLFIARALVSAHGGRIEVRSAPGERTVFTVRLPREPPRASPTEGPEGAAGEGSRP